MGGPTKMILRVGPPPPSIQVVQHFTGPAFTGGRTFVGHLPRLGFGFASAIVLARIRNDFAWIWAVDRTVIEPIAAGGHRPNS